MTLRAIILAAGAGTRLNPLTNNKPKCLVPFGKGPIIDLQIAALRLVGVDDIVLVTGYESDQIRHHCHEMAKVVHFVDNVDFACTNSIYSLYLARHYLDRETFLFNCDIVFHSAILERMLASSFPNTIAVDSQIDRIAGEMNVKVFGDGTVSAIGKNLDPNDCQAQSVQLVKFDESGARSVSVEVERLVEKFRKDVFPTSAYSPIIRRSEFGAVECGDLPWAEIDSVSDYNFALKEVMPRL